MTKTISAEALHDALTDGGEIALLDVREEGVFAKRHILRACPMALSRLEVMVAKLVPRRGCRVVLCDAGDGLAERAAARLTGFGYADVSVLAGGVEAWADAGYELYAGVNVPSKAFGEFVEVAYDTPRITAAELDAWRAAGDDLVILDSRPYPEFRNMSIPGGVDCPGAELAYRVHDAAPSAATTVVVNCAGRTRSIIGAQSLINAGVANRVVALENGTMGWHLAGLELARGAEALAPEVSADGLAKAQAAATRVAQRFGVQTIDDATLARFKAEAAERSLFVFDVRNPEEYEAGHRADARLAAGGQLVQATDQYVGTAGARLVLVDDTGVRATMTASWLVQLGWRDTYVLAGGLGDDPLVTGPEASEVLGLASIEADEVSAAELDAMLAAGSATVVDLEDSLRFRDGHIPGAWYAVRARFPDQPRQGAGHRRAYPDLARRAARPARRARRGGADGGPGQAADRRHPGVARRRAAARDRPHQHGRRPRRHLLPAVRRQPQRRAGDERLSGLGGRPGRADRARRHHRLRALAGMTREPPAFDTIDDPAPRPCIAA